MVSENIEQYTNAIIYVDSQAAIKAVIKPRRQSGQEIICEILDKAEQLQAQRSEITITIIWIPGYMDIAGNETVDEAAKEAAKTQGEIGEPHRYATLKSGQNAVIHKANKDQWNKEWSSERCKAKQLHDIGTRPHMEAGARLYSQISSRRRLTWLTRLRTGHCGLNEYLQRFGLVESAQCSCEWGIESVRHYLLICPNYEQERDKLRRNVGMQGMRVENLLGDPQLIHHTLDYVAETKRFDF